MTEDEEEQAGGEEVSIPKFQGGKGKLMTVCCDFSSFLGDTGLQNLGNTCYMNAVLQALIHLPGFRATFLESPPEAYHHKSPKAEQSTSSQRRATRSNQHTDLPPENVSLRYHLSALLHAMREKERYKSNGKRSISPVELHTAVGKVMPYFRGCLQQDSQEFLLHLLERIGWEEKEHGCAQEGSAVEQFTGALMSELRCKSCGQVSMKNEPFTDLSLALPVHLLDMNSKRKCKDETASRKKQRKGPELVGKRFVDEGETWQIHEVSYQPELQCTVAFYFDVAQVKPGEVTLKECKFVPSVIICVKAYCCRLIYNTLKVNILAFRKCAR
jgi:hypothetical protein